MKFISRIKYGLEREILGLKLAYNISMLSITDEDKKRISVDKNKKIDPVRISVNVQGCFFKIVDDIMKNVLILNKKLSFNADFDELRFLANSLLKKSKKLFRAILNEGKTDD